MAWLQQQLLLTADRRWLLPWRLYLAAAYLTTGVGKLVGAAPWAGGGLSWSETLAVALQRSLPSSRAPHFVAEVVLPNIDGFAALIAWGEAAVGLALLLGAGTRLAAAGVLVLAASRLVARGEWIFSSGLDPAFFALGLAVLLGAAGRVYGVDTYLARRWPQGWLW